MDGSAPTTDQSTFAQKQALAKVAAAQRAAEASIANECANYFCFGDVTWLATHVDRHRAANGAVEFPALVEDWLRHRWAHKMESYSYNPELLQACVDRTCADPNVPLCFSKLVEFVYAYQEFHLETEKWAGFSKHTVKAITAQFQPYDKNGDGLRARELWAILSDFGVCMADQEDQLWMVDLVRQMDKDHSGTIDVYEFCQILRKVGLRRERMENLRELELIMQSNIAFSEAEEWVPVFRRSDNERRNGLTMVQLSQLFENIGIKWGVTDNQLLRSWILESNPSFRNTLSFGEFCCLIQKMVAEDFKGIRSATANSKEHLMNGRDHSRWSQESNLQLSWNNVFVEPSSPTWAPRASVFDFEGIEKQQSNLSVNYLAPKSEEMVDALASTLESSKLSAAAYVGA